MYIYLGLPFPSSNGVGFRFGKLVAMKSICTKVIGVGLWKTPLDLFQTSICCVLSRIMIFYGFLKALKYWTCCLRYLLSGMERFELVCSICRIKIIFVFDWKILYPLNLLYCNRYRRTSKPHSSRAGLPDGL
jgi:hypothetical protein